MKKIFKSRKIKTTKIKKIFLLFIISFFSALYLSKLEIFKNKELLNILNNASLNKLYLNKIDFKGQYLINVGLNSFKKIKFTKEVFKQKDINNINNPKIYIYNTHQTEEYQTIENYNLTPTVLTASLILKDKLKELNIDSIVETRDLKTDLNNMGYSYRQAYKVSRKWLEDLNNPNLSLYIDLHRDSVKKSISDIEIDNETYAKIMFVVGTNYNYQDNMNVADSIIKEIESINKSISRGIFTRFSVYNQDYNKNCILIEVGGPESTYQSVSNSIDILAHAIKNYLGE